MSETSAPAPTLGLRHAVLWVREPRASAEFYGAALGLEVKAEMGEGEAIFLKSPNSTTDHDLGLFRAAAPTPPAARQLGLYHLAWEVPTLGDLAAARDRLSELGALVGMSDHGATRSLYAQDPDGIEFEVMWEVPDGHDVGEITTRPLDLEGDIARFGADLPGKGA